MTTSLQYQQQTSAPGKNQRRCTVGYLPNAGDTTTPAIRLSGKWLRDAGFETGKGVTIKIAADCIVLIPDNDDICELNRQLKQANQLIAVVKEGAVHILK